MTLDFKGRLLALSLLALGAGAQTRPADDDDDDNNGPGLGDAVDAVDTLHDLSGHGGSAEHAHLPSPVPQAEAERFVVHGGMSWEELAKTHQGARAAGTSVQFGEAAGHAPNPFQVESSLRPLGSPSAEARFGHSAMAFGASSEAQLGREAVQFGRGGTQLARGAQFVESGSLGAGRVALSVVEDVGVGSLGVARIAEEGLLLKVGGAALGLGGLAASRRRRQD